MCAATSRRFVFFKELLQEGVTRKLPRKAVNLRPENLRETMASKACGVHDSARMFHGKCDA
jgi:hypothetical protein